MVPFPVFSQTCLLTCPSRLRKNESDGRVFQGPDPRTLTQATRADSARRLNADSAQDAGCSPCFAAENVQEITVADMKNVELPPLWRRIALEDRSGEYVASFTVTSTHRALQIEKCVCVGGDSKASASAHGRPVKAFFNLSLHSLNDLSILLDKVDKLLICHGQQHNGGCLSPKCKVLSPQETCSSCRAQKKKLLGNALRRKERLTWKQKKMKNLQKKAMRAAAAKVAFLKEIKNLKEELTCRPTETIKEAIKSLPPIQQVAFETSLNNVKVKGPQGVRYARTWVMNCLLLRIASPKAYNLLRSMKLLPLPTCSRLNQILSGVPCEYGYNEVALDTICAFFRDKPAVQRCGTLVLDEIKLKESLDFNKSTYKFDGFVNFSSSQGEAATVPADHALAIMFIPLFHNWVQPVASFATRGAAPGFVLAKLVLECVIELERHNALVIAVVSDGAGNNRSMWKHVGISGKLHSPVNKIPHPTLEEGRFLHFLCDVPHILKCVRNHLLSHTYAKVSKNAHGHSTVQYYQASGNRYLCSLKMYFFFLFSCI